MAFLCRLIQLDRHWAYFCDTENHHRGFGYQMLKRTLIGADSNVSRLNASFGGREKSKATARIVRKLDERFSSFRNEDDEKSGMGWGYLFVLSFSKCSSVAFIWRPLWSKENLNQMEYSTQREPTRALKTCVIITLMMIGPSHSSSLIFLPLSTNKDNCVISREELGFVIVWLCHSIETPRHRPLLIGSHNQ